jgi:hypothetical protein
MALRAALKFAFLAGLIFWSVAASAADPDPFKGEIEAYFKQLGALHWDGTDSFTVHRDGDAAVAVIENGRFSLRKVPTDPTPVATITLGHLEIRRKPASGASDVVTYVISYPPITTLTTTDGTEMTLSLSDAMATAQVAEPGNRYRSLTGSFTSGRLERKGAADWLKLGPLTVDTGISPADGGGWASRVNFDFKTLEFLLADAPLAGKIERIGYTGETGGPSLSELDALREQLADLREKTADDPTQKPSLWLAVVPKIFDVFQHSQGALTIEGTTVKRADGETLVSLAKATIAGSANGLGGDKASLRWTISHEGLAIAPSLIAEPQVPQRMVIDIGIEDIAGAPLRTILEAAGKTMPGASDADKQAALPQIIAAAMALQPVLRIYGITIEFKEVRIDATSEAKRGPPPPIGYTAGGDVTVHGFDALPAILTSENDRNVLPLLKFLGEPGTDTDGAKILKFHLASQTGKPIAINGNDISDWFHGAGQFGRMPAGPPRLLRLAEPFEEGDDVRAVQKAVKADASEPLTDGVYDTATALAVARFQKDSGLNISGVVDPATAAKLGLKPPEKPPASPKN